MLKLEIRRCKMDPVYEMWISVLPIDNRGVRALELTGWMRFSAQEPEPVARRHVPPRVHFFEHLAPCFVDGRPAFSSRAEHGSHGSASGTETRREENEGVRREKLRVHTHPSLGSRRPKHSTAQHRRPDRTIPHHTRPHQQQQHI